MTFSIASRMMNVTDAHPNILNLERNSLNPMMIFLADFNICMCDSGNNLCLHSLVRHNLVILGGSERIIYLEGGEASYIGTGDCYPNLCVNHSELIP